MQLTRSLACLALAAGCGSSSAKPDAPTSPDDGASPDVPGHVPGMPGVGFRGLAYYKLQNGGMPTQPTLSTPSGTTQASGSTIIVSVGRGDKSMLGLPTDSKGNGPYQPVGVVHPYHNYLYSGTAVYAYPAAAGGSGFSVTVPAGAAGSSTPFPGTADEITMAAVEVIEGSHIQDFSWAEVTSAPIRSASVTTTAPATLIAYWWGDGFFQQPQSAMAQDGFLPLGDNTANVDSFVQCAFAYKNVATPGTYSVSWVPNPAQGAQLWLIAVQ